MIHLLLTYPAQQPVLVIRTQHNTACRKIPDANLEMWLELAASLDPRSSSPENSLADERLRYFVPLVFESDDLRFGALSAIQAGTDTKLRATIIDSVTDNKHY